jgi:hypothetical protein
MGRGNRCWRCQLADMINTLPQGPDGLIPELLQPLAQALIDMPRPNSGYLAAARPCGPRSTPSTCASRHPA